MKASAAKQPTTTATASQTTEIEKSGVNELVEIIERGSFYEMEIPLSPDDVSKLYAAAKSHAQIALTLGDCSPELYADYFDTRLADLKACVEASRTGKFNVPPREMKRFAGIVAMKLLRETCEWSECLVEEGREKLKDALAKNVS
jgi:hypothetical protein